MSVCLCCSPGSQSGKAYLRHRADGDAGLPQHGFSSSEGGMDKQSGRFCAQIPCQGGTPLVVDLDQKAVTESECAELRNCCTCLLPSHTLNSV